MVNVAGSAERKYSFGPTKEESLWILLPSCRPQQTLCMKCRAAFISYGTVGLLSLIIINSV